MQIRGGYDERMKERIALTVVENNRHQGRLEVIMKHVKFFSVEINIIRYR